MSQWLEDLRFWVATRGLWYGISAGLHAIGLFIVLMFLSLVVTPPKQEGHAPLFDAKIDTTLPEAEIDHFDVGETPLEPSQLDTDTLSLVDAPQLAQEEQINTTSKDAFVEAGGGSQSGAMDSIGGIGGFNVMATGPGAAVRGGGGVGGGKGTSGNPGAGGGGTGYAGRGAGVRSKLVGSYGGTKGSERAVAAALNWLARHQNRDGGWSLGGFARNCKGDVCTGPGGANTDVAATAMALLPFLAAGQTHRTKGPYRETITGGLKWLLANEKKNGDLRGPGGTMYSQGLATITLCEAFGLSGDPALGAGAQEAIRFIEQAQHTTSGGWAYDPFDNSKPMNAIGDTSIVGWQVMALKSAQMAGLKVNHNVLAGAGTWLKSVASGKDKGLFAYTPATGASPTMVAVGMLCTQYLGATRDQPNIREGMAFFVNNLPSADSKARSCYYWYYATQVMHNMPGREWDVWNRQMRRVLIDSQVKEGCAAGSWDPLKPDPDPFASQGGRIYVTSLCCLTLEVYYRYLPLYKLNQGGDAVAKADKGKK